MASRALALALLLWAVPGAAETVFDNHGVPVRSCWETGYGYYDLWYPSLHTEGLALFDVKGTLSYDTTTVGLWGIGWRNADGSGRVEFSMQAHGNIFFVRVNLYPSFDTGTAHYYAIQGVAYSTMAIEPVPCP